MVKPTYTLLRHSLCVVLSSTAPEISQGYKEDVFLDPIFISVKESLPTLGCDGQTLWSNSLIAAISTLVLKQTCTAPKYSDTHSSVLSLVGDFYAR